MKNEHTERYTRASLPPGETDWDRVDALTDREIKQAAAEDPDAAPPLDASFYEGADLVRPAESARVTVALPVDPELLRYYQAMGPSYQEVMHSALLRFALERGGASAHAGMKSPELSATAELIAEIIVDILAKEAFGRETERGHVGRMLDRTRAADPRNKAAG